MSAFLSHRYHSNITDYSNIVALNETYSSCNQPDNLICIYLNTYTGQYCVKLQIKSGKTLFTQFRASSMCCSVLTYRQKHTFLFMQIIIFPHVRFCPILDMFFWRLLILICNKNNFCCRFI